MLFGKIFHKPTSFPFEGCVAVRESDTSKTDRIKWRRLKMKIEPSETISHIKCC